ncbi:MAG: serine hydrolase domain-containing protein [Solirubrobacteraceae bacterium]
MADGLTDSGLEALRALAEGHVGDAGVPGVVALVARHGQVHVEALGSLSYGGAPIARDSLFRIASITKPVTAAATMALADEGLLALDDPIDELVPELAARRVLVRMDGPLEDTVAAERAITARDLLTFTFGFGLSPAMFGGPDTWPVLAAERELRLATFGMPDPDLQPDPDTWIANLGTLPLLAQPGERWLYNTGSSVLGVLCARAARRPFAEVLETRLFTPLGMSDTAFWTADTERLATAYRWSPDGLLVADEPGGAWSRPPVFGDGAAGLLSTVDDLHTFARMLLDGGAGVLSAAAVAAMTTDQLTDEQKSHGGLDPKFFVGRSWSFGQAVHDSGAFGWDGGFGTTWLVDPPNDLVVIVFTQRIFETYRAPQVHRDLQRAAYAALA